MSINHFELTLDDVVVKNIINLIGKVCCRQRIGRGRSLSIGFGERVFHGKSNMPDDFYGEWEIGTYTASWRVVQKDIILCGSQDVVDEDAELDQLLNTILLGRVAAITNIGKLDIRVDMDNGIHIDFLGCSTEDDEMFHIFGPENLYIEYSVKEAWKIGKSNKPWT